MARLQDVIASVLRDVLSAQHQANLLTESLADQYREVGVMHQLNLPAVTIGDLELSFRFAIEDTCELFEEKIGRRNKDVGRDCGRRTAGRTARERYTQHHAEGVYAQRRKDF